MQNHKCRGFPKVCWGTAKWIKNLSI